MERYDESKKTFPMTITMPNNNGFQCDFSVQIEFVNRSRCEHTIVDDYLKLCCAWNRIFSAFSLC